MSDEGDAVTLKIKWQGRVFDLVTHSQETVVGIKRKLEASTTVQPRRQKILGFKTRDGKPAGDDCAVGDLLLKPGATYMLLGTPEESISALQAQSEVAPEIQDDFELDVPASELDPSDLRDRPEIQARLAKRIASTEIKLLQQPRPGKKLLVLDIDYTLFDLGSTAERPEQLARPFLHEFLAAAYEHYDIAIWSATSMKWIEVKMRELGVSTHPAYKLTFMLDHMAMVTVNHAKHGVFNCKPLGFIWEKLSANYSPSNTIMMDDLRRNYVLNPQNGLVIRPFRKAHRTRDKDRELLYLKEYLLKIAPLESLDGLDHDDWETFAAPEIAAARRALKHARMAAEDA